MSVSSKLADDPTADLRIAFVNNMPDAAFEETEQQFRDLIVAGAGRRRVHLRRYYLPNLKRGPAVRRRIVECYLDISHLYANPPDALIMTGTEPKCTDLRDEPFWHDVEQLLHWAEEHVVSMLLSCLASHAALLALDGVERTPLATKCSGVFEQRVMAEHSIVAGVAPVAYPHSRQNGIDPETLERHGYSVLLGSADAGWTIATAVRGRSLLVLFQGHPEYSPTTLLREYRRDVRRFLDGERSDYPPVPAGYLDRRGVRYLETFRTRAIARGYGVAAMRKFPFDAAASSIAVDWRRPSQALMSNWITEVERRALTVGARL